MGNPRWEYDGSIRRFPIAPGELWACQHGKAMAADLYDGLPPFMTGADCVFVDPPYNAALENGFRTKAGLDKNPSGFARFLDMLFGRIDQIRASTVFVEIGRQNVNAVEQRLRSRFPHLRRYDSTYYRKEPCFVFRAGQSPGGVDYQGLDEADIIEKVCAEEPFQTIADPCMGRGLVGVGAFRRGRRFCGTELNPARLAVMLSRIADIGGQWQCHSPT